MKKRQLMTLLLLILSLAVLLCACGNKKQEMNQEIKADAAAPATEPASAPAATITPEDAGINASDVPPGIYLVEGPPQNDTYSYPKEETSSNQTTPEGITIVDAPEGQSGTNSGIYIVDPPSGGGTNSGIYIVDQPSGGGGNSGIHIVDPPSDPGGKIIASGSFSSSTGTALNIRTSYSAVTVDSNTVRVDVSATLSYGALTANSNKVTFKLGSQTSSRTAPSINYSGSGASTNLGSTSFTVNLSSGHSTSLGLNVSWYFGGSYSGVPIDYVTASGTVNLSR